MEMKTAFETSLWLDGIGDVSVSTRGPGGPTHGYSSDPVFSAERADIRLRVGFDGDVGDDGVSVALWAHHVQNTLNETVFHDTMDCVLGWAEVRALHAYLGFLLENQPTPSAEKSS